MGGRSVRPSVLARPLLDSPIRRLTEPLSAPPLPSSSLRLTERQPCGLLCTAAVAMGPALVTRLRGRSGPPVGVGVCAPPCECWLEGAWPLASQLGAPFWPKLDTVAT